MKIFITLLGVILIAGGAYLAFDGYQVKQTTSAKIEKEVSTAIKYITDDAIKPKTRRKSTKILILRWLEGPPR